MPGTRELSILAKTYRAYRKRTDTCAYPPTRMWVEPSSHCNLRCSFCVNRELPDEHRGFMDLDLYRKIADETAGYVRQLNLFHRGESLLHPQIGEMVRYANHKSFRTRIHTNGTVLTPDLAGELIDSQLGVLSFSFDGYDREMYDANRPNADFDVVLGNILGLLATKRKLDSRKPFVAIELMEITDDPPDEVQRKRGAFLARFKGLPLDKFIIRKPHNWGGQVDVGSDCAQSSQARIPCPLLWHALVVFWDGRILPCPQDFFGSLQIGDARNDRLMEVWNGDEIRNMRREMSDLISLDRKPCTDCDRIRRASVAGIPVDYLGRFLSETVFGNRWLGRILPH